eukprot:TRINITY_DN12414_c0_g2_i11.p4 TRINITY_DN12414_c0_g2~~TRINITY_DN12414_c0_g2_i11.p4  ORF type:complete len:184 (-),score=31.26 TRINITY_DN12414_c0_g2_i11:166-717(-)
MTRINMQAQEGLGSMILAALPENRRETKMLKTTIMAILLKVKLLKIRLMVIKMMIKCKMGGAIILNKFGRDVILVTIIIILHQKNEEFVSTVDGRRRGIYMGRKQQPQQQQQSNQDRFQRSQQRWNQQEDRRGRGERRWRVNKRPDSPDVWRHDKFEELKEQDQEEEEEEEVQFQEGTVELEY